MTRIATPPLDLTYTVRRCSPELVAPAKPTPHEFKPLSDLDDQEGVRFQIAIIQFYKAKAAMVSLDPVKVIRKAISEALVYYYPLAGRAREGAAPGGKLVVECTGEGVLFIEAETDVELKQFGDVLFPPLPCVDQLLPHGGSGSGAGPILDSPLMLFQVTRLKCGGFVFALRLSHIVCDGTGLLQFLNAVGEIARGASTPSIRPVWQRYLLTARTPPRITHLHHEFDELDESKDVTFPLNDMTYASFFFSSTMLSAILTKHAPNREYSSFEVITACIWRCSIRSLDLDPGIEVRTVFPVNVRHRFQPQIPIGYYGNAYTLAMAISNVGELCRNSLEYALELVKAAKDGITEEYMRSFIDCLVINGRRSHTSVGASYVSAGHRLGFGDVDFGWGEAAYGGRAHVWGGAQPRIASLIGPSENYGGEEGTMVTVYLPYWAVERFEKEVDDLMKDPSFNSSSSSSRILSAL